MAPPQSRTTRKPTRAGLTDEDLLLDAEEDDVRDDLSDAPFVCPRLVTFAWYFAGVQRRRVMGSCEWVGLGQGKNEKESKDKVSYRYEHA